MFGSGAEGDPLLALVVKGMAHPTLRDLLNQGNWERPSDRMAIYTEFLDPGDRWGIRVTLIEDSAKVEAIDGPHCVWYHAAAELSSEVAPVTWLERLRGITFQQKLMAEVTRKRAYAAAKNAEES